MRRFVVRLAVEGNDRRGLYADVGAAVNQTGTDIRRLSSRPTTARYSAPLVEVENHTHLDKVMQAVRRVKGVSEIARRDAGVHTEPSAG